MSTGWNAEQQFWGARCACTGLGQARMNVCCLDVKICSFDHFVVANFTQQCHSSVYIVLCQLPVCVVCRDLLSPMHMGCVGAWERGVAYKLQLHSKGNCHT